jgi:AraC-like DNA-binding protein
MNREKKLPIYFLSLFTFIFSMAVIGKVLFFLEIYSKTNIFYYLNTSLLFGMGPAVFWYFKLQLQESPSFQFKNMIHFLPLLIECFFYLLSSSLFIQKNYNLIYNIEQSLAQLSVITYTAISYKLLRENQSKNVKRYKTLILLYMAGILLWIFYVIINVSIFDDNMVISDYYPLYFYAAFVVYSISYTSYLKPLLANTQKKHQKELPENYQIFANKISNYMVKKKPFLNPNLRIKDFAVEVGLPQNAVSEVINHIFNKTFSDYIADYRINSVIEKLLSKDIEIHTIESIALENGFNSRSSFNTSFKKITGYTPKRYLLKYK